jgi:pimeloyl-ACP methyl ester carboxylesterase
VPAGGKTVSVNGIDMYFESAGQGPPLVLLHGFNNSGNEWATALRFLDPNR